MKASGRISRAFVVVPDPEGGWSVHLEGVVDAPCARKLERLILSSAGRRLTLDFRRVRECHDVALAMLARQLRDSAGRVALLGLSEHHAKLLGYFGVVRNPGEPRDPAALPHDPFR